MALPTTTCCAGCNRPGLPVDMRQCPRCFIGSRRTICSCCKMCAACDGASPFKKRRPDDRSPAWTTALNASWGQVDRFFLEGPPSHIDGSQIKGSNQTRHSTADAADVSCSLKDKSSNTVHDSSTWNIALNALTGGSWKDVLNIWSN